MGRNLSERRKTLTVRNTNFTIQAAYGVFAENPGTTIILENCNFGPKFQYCTNQPGNGKLIARNTTFRGWMSGWSDGFFENCTFKHGDLSCHTPAAMAAACSKTANLNASPQPPTTVGFRQLLTEKTPRATPSMTTTMLCHA